MDLRIVKKIQDILGKIIKKLLFIEKLLSKLFFRFLYDIIILVSIGYCNCFEKFLMYFVYFVIVLRYYKILNVLEI